MYGVMMTPHFFVVDAEGILIYQGALDDQPGEEASQNETFLNYVERAIDQAEDGGAVDLSTTQPYGCPIKSRP
jgi:hypothetical protein